LERACWPSIIIVLLPKLKRRHSAQVLRRGECVRKANTQASQKYLPKSSRSGIVSDSGTSFEELAYPLSFRSEPMRIIGYGPHNAPPQPWPEMKPHLILPSSTTCTLFTLLIYFPCTSIDSRAYSLRISEWYLVPWLKQNPNILPAKPSSIRSSEASLTYQWTKQMATRSPPLNFWKLQSH